MGNGVFDIQLLAQQGQVQEQQTGGAQVDVSMSWWIILFVSDSSTHICHDPSYLYYSTAVIVIVVIMKFGSLSR